MSLLAIGEKFKLRQASMVSVEGKSQSYYIDLDDEQEKGQAQRNTDLLVTNHRLTPEWTDILSVKEFPEDRLRHMDTSE